MTDWRASVLAPLLALLLLVGCKVDLYGGLSEEETNPMVVLPLEEQATVSYLKEQLPESTQTFILTAAEDGVNADHPTGLYWMAVTVLAGLMLSGALVWLLLRCSVRAHTERRP